jgi:hypothetical protein
VRIDDGAADPKKNTVIPFFNRGFECHVDVFDTLDVEVLDPSRAPLPSAELQHSGATVMNDQPNSF